MFRKLRNLIYLLFVCPSLLAADQVILQLKWEHQFQFAGYYAAEWQGFYKEVGLEVDIRSAANADKEIISPNQALKNNEAQFAVGALDILLAKAEGISPVVLAPIFQQSALSLFSLKKTDISELEKVSRLRIAATASTATKIEIESLFRSKDYSIEDINFVEQPLTIETLIDEKADVIATYHTSAHFEAQERGVELNELKPSDYGINFYGDTLYTTEKYAKANSDIVNRFINASLKGWVYALNNKQSIAQRIANELPRYIVNIDDAYAFNLAFSKDIDKYIKFPEIPVGHLNKVRWFNMNERIRSMGMVKNQLNIDEFYFKTVQQSIYKPDRSLLLLLIGILIPSTFFFWFRGYRIFTYLAILASAAIIEIQLENILLKEQSRRDKANISQKLNTITAQLQGNLQTNLSMLTGFAAYISASPNLTSEDFDRYAKQLFKKNPILINFAAAKDLKVNYIYPLKGNEKAIGLNYRETPSQVDMVMQVIKTGQMMVIGPVNLVQGGKAFIGRAPIVTADGKLWGIISAPIDAEKLFLFAELDKLSQGIELAIRSFDALGEPGPVFYGNSKVLSDPNRLSSVISVGGGSWHLDASINVNQLKTATNILALRAYFLFATIFSCIFVWFRFNQHQEKKALESKIKDDKLLLESVGSVAKIGGWKLDFNLNFVHWSSHCSVLIGQDKNFSPTKLTRLESFFSNEDSKEIMSSVKAAISHSKPFDIEVSLNQKSNSPMWLRLMCDGLTHNDDNAIMGTIQDVTSKVISAKLIEHQATFDSLTGLPNRVLYNDRLEKSIDLAKRENKTVAVLFIDLDRFKPINDNHGHHAGDNILVETANRIKSSIRRSDTVSRLSGDEFAVILNDVKDYLYVRRIAEKIIARIQQPFTLEDASVYSSASVGISLYPDDAKDANSLLRNSDQAMYEVKASGRNGCQFYTKEMQQRSENRHKMLNELILAINNKSLEAYYQPIYSLAKNKLVRCESLARWQRENGEFVSPVDFIELAEESGLINKIDLLMLEQSAETLAAISPEIGLSINISPRLFHTKDKALESWMECIKSVSKKINITVEITERLLTDDSDSVLIALEELQKYGIQIAIDDFGTGYSSLSYLIKYPVDIIKIDRCFIQNIGIEASAEALIETILAMAKRLDIKVVAEGIESNEQLEYLVKHQCDYGQGYLLGRPMDKNSFRHFVKAHFLKQNC